MLPQGSEPEDQGRVERSRPALAAQDQGPVELFPLASQEVHQVKSRADPELEALSRQASPADPQGASLQDVLRAVPLTNQLPIAPSSALISPSMWICASLLTTSKVTSRL
ncbi:MAG: hypothetical protein C4297_08900 [Gemmataceae bacterium]